MVYINYFFSVTKEVDNCYSTSSWFLLGKTLRRRRNQLLAGSTTAKDPQAKYIYLRKGQEACERLTVRWLLSHCGLMVSVQDFGLSNSEWALAGEIALCSVLGQDAFTLPRSLDRWPGKTLGDYLQRTSVPSRERRRTSTSYFTLRKGSSGVGHYTRVLALT